MISKIGKGTTFRGLIKYVENRKEATPIADNFLSIDQKDRIKFFNEVAGVNTRLKKKSFHASLSLSPGETLTEEQWKSAAEEYVERMGFGNSPWIAVKHDDKEYEHIHIVASRVDYDGKTVSDSKDVDKSFKAVRALEKKFGLLETLKKPRKTIAQLDTKEQKTLAHGKKLQKTILREAVTKAMAASSNLDEFQTEVEKEGIQVVRHTRKSGEIFGVSFKIGDIAIKASSLGKEYSYSKLIKRLKPRIPTALGGVKLTEEQREKIKQGEPVLVRNMQTPKGAMTGMVRYDLKTRRITVQPEAKREKENKNTSAEIDKAMADIQSANRTKQEPEKKEPPKITPKTRGGGGFPGL